MFRNIQKKKNCLFVTQWNCKLFHCFRWTAPHLKENGNLSMPENLVRILSEVVERGWGYGRGDWQFLCAKWNSATRVFLGANFDQKTKLEGETIFLGGLRFHLEKTQYGREGSPRLWHYASFRRKLTILGATNGVDRVKMKSPVFDLRQNFRKSISKALLFAWSRFGHTPGTT